MTFLPIVARELRVGARRRGTYWTRTAVALGAIGTGSFYYLTGVGASQYQGHRVFVALMGLSVLYCLYAGRRFTADCLSEEKREGTLGLLFLTDLKGYDVILGKLTATSLNGFYGLLSVFPVMAVPLLLGGISSGEFWRVVLVLANTFLYSLAIGMLASTLSRNASRAMGANLLVLLLLSAVPPACAFALHALHPGIEVVKELFYSCPVFSLYLCDDAVYRVMRWDFWWSVGVVHGLTWLLLGLASWIVPHSWQDRASANGTARWSGWWRAWKFGAATRRDAFRKRLLDLNAFYWLAARVRLKPALVWGFFICIGCYWFGTWKAFSGPFAADALNPANLASACILNFALKLWIAIEAGQRLAEDRKSGAFELLLSTPLTGREIVRGQWLALRRQFLKPTLVAIAVQCSFLVLGAQQPSGDSAMAVVTWGAIILMLVADMTAVSWVSMASALTVKSPNLAIISAIMRTLAVPFVLASILQGIATALASLQGMRPPGAGAFLIWWFSSGLLFDLVLGLSARDQLLSRFHQLAAGRYSPAPQGPKLRAH